MKIEKDYTITNNLFKAAVGLYYPTTDDVRAANKSYLDSIMILNENPNLRIL